MLEEYMNNKDDQLIPFIDGMEAKHYLRVKDRIRGNLPLPDFKAIARTGPSATENERVFACMKAALLAVEAALPVGCVDTSENGPWRPEYAQAWRVSVQNSEGPWNLMRCVILLEDMFTEEWIKPQIGHLRSCLPNRWKALEEASPSSVAMRIALLDRGILYDHVDKKRFKPTKSKK